MHPDHHSADLIVVGSGVAGLSAALAAADAGARVALLTGGALLSGSSPRAQGGIAAAVGADDRPELHAADTLAVGAGLNSPQAVHVLVHGGRTAVQDLLATGVPFDGGPQHPELGLEAGHGRRRILHANGTATGRALTMALLARVVEHPCVAVHAQTPAEALVGEGSRIVGVRSGGATHRARAVVLATGGYAALWGRTTNSGDSRGTGLALAWWAGASLADLEFVQFHPTALALPDRPAYLLSEALRGEGALLVDSGGRPVVDPLLPRDVVARAIARHLREHGPVYLSLRHLDPGFVWRRFPNIAAQLQDWGLDLARDLLPVAPAAHYCMGGVRTDNAGRTDVPGLYVAGEAACTGAQGANRLASNSLLECLVFGRRAALAALSDGPGDRRQATGDSGLAPCASRFPPPAVQAGCGDVAAEGTGLGAEPAGHGRAPFSGRLSPVACRLDDAALGDALDRDLGVERDAARLSALVHALPDPDRTTTPTAHLVAALAARAALLREESRGAHYRDDAPEPREEWRGRLCWRRGMAPEFERIEP
jgi:L-aspartate oxidase